MNQPWNQVRIQQLIDDEVEESLTLDYKAAGAIAKNPANKTEITKDVSAFANSAGGLIIYGVAEYKQPSKKHLPEKIDPIDRTQFSREWLDQIIGTIQPRISGIIIHPVPINSAPNHVVYVVEIPQSVTVHQATNKLYYKRSNFESIPMEDYEIRDVMNRDKHPKIDISFEIEMVTKKYADPLPTMSVNSNRPEPKTYTYVQLSIKARNLGVVYAQYVNVFVRVPRSITYADAFKRKYGIDEQSADLSTYEVFSYSNTTRDVVDSVPGPFGSPKYGPARYVPILPGLRKTWDLKLRENFSLQDFAETSIYWTAHTDNAPVNEGEIMIGDIPLIDRRKNDVQAHD